MNQDGSDISSKSGKKHQKHIHSTIIDNVKPASISRDAKDPRPHTTALDDHLIWPSESTPTRENETADQAEERLRNMCGAVKTLLECIGEDTNRPGLGATPSRYAKALLSLTKGYGQDVQKVTNAAMFEEEYNGIVLVKDIKINSLCEHHLLPFSGKMHVGYVPSGRVIGLSKLARVAEVFARRLQMQERLTEQVAHALMQLLEPQGVAVVVECSHLCMAMRGVEQTSTTTMTNCLVGRFEHKPRVRNQFFGLLGISKP